MSVNYPGDVVTPNLGLSLAGMNVDLATNFITLDTSNSIGVSNMGNSIVLNSSGITWTDRFGNVIASNNTNILLNAGSGNSIVIADSSGNRLRLGMGGSFGQINLTDFNGNVVLLLDNSGNLTIASDAGRTAKFGAASSTTLSLSSTSASLSTQPLTTLGTIFTAAAPTVAASQVGLGSTTATSATAGSNGDVPAQVVGYLIINVAGTTAKIPYYNS